MKLPPYFIFCSKLFLVFLFFFFLFTSKSFANCLDIKDSILGIKFLKDGDNGCIRSQNMSLPIINNDSKLDFIINSDYTFSFTFRRNGGAFSNDGDEQTLFAIYDNSNVLVAKAYLKYDGDKGGQFIYDKAGSVIKRINMSAINNDPDISKEHSAIIAYNRSEKKLVINIDGFEVLNNNINPISSNKIKNISIGGRLNDDENPYVGQIKIFEAYRKFLKFEQRSEQAQILKKSSPSGSIVIYEPIKDDNGVIRSVELSGSIECPDGYDLIDDNCQIIVASGGGSPESGGESPESDGESPESGGGSPESGGEDTTTGCYDSSNVGKIGDAAWDDGICAGMLIVSEIMLRGAVADFSFNFTPENTYTRHSDGNIYTDDKTYTFANGQYTIFTGQVTDMSRLFFAKGLFNEDISHWDVSNVTNMAVMFYYARSFNQNLSDWCVQNVQNVDLMFKTMFDYLSPLTDENLPNFDNPPDHCI
jgi:surface protein